jgi:hypothetical protein
MGFGIRIAPGVRIRASSRGIGASVGPRIARVHVGPGSAGVSSGLGRFSAYSGSSTRRRSYGGRTPTLASYQRQLVAIERQAERERQLAEKLREIEELERLEAALVSVHLEEFPTARAPRAPAPEPVDVEALRRRVARETGLGALEEQIAPFGRPPKAPTARELDHKAVHGEYRKEALRAVPLLWLGQRREAKEQARMTADAAIAAEEEKRRQQAAAEQERLDALWGEVQAKEVEVAAFVESEQQAETERRTRANREEQERLDKQWQLLQANDPATVLATLEAAFADNEAPAAGIDCQSATVTVAMKFEHPDAIPERRPALTPAGRPTIKKRTKTERNELYFRTLASNVLATVKEAFAVAPAIHEAKVIVIREERSDRHRDKLAAIYAGRFVRGNCDLSAGHPDLEIEYASDALVNKKGRTEEIAPLDLRDEPEVQQALEQLARDLRLEAVVPAKRRSTKRAG